MKTKLSAFLIGGVIASSPLSLSLQAADFAQSPAVDKIPEHVQLPVGAMAGYYFASNLRSLKSRKFSLPLPDGGAMDLLGRPGRPFPNGSQVWSGSVEGESDSSALITQHGKALAGVIRFAGRVFKIQQVSEEIHMLMEVTPNEPYPESDPIESDGLAATGSSTGEATDQASDDGSQIDVMIVYSTDTKQRYGGLDGVNAHIALAITESNQAYATSQVGTQLRLVHTAEVINSLGDSGSDLAALRSTNDGVMDHVHSLRDQYGADMVSWFSEVPGTCGRAYVNTGDIRYDAAYGFSVVASDCATGYYSTAHELGHNMGSTHNVEANPGTPIYAYSYGYQDPGENFRTIMAYNCPGGCSREQFFSNPDLTFNGLVTGIEGEADNARSLNQTRTPVSQWRSAVVGAAPVADFTYNCTLLACSFTDSSTASNPITQWSWDFGDQQGSTLQNPTHTFSQSGNYSVQLNITDDTGASAFTIVSVNVMDTVPEPPAQPAFSSVSVSGSDVVLSWNDDTNVGHYTLERERRHPKNGKWTSLTALGTVVSPHTDQPGGGDYRYRLTAHNEFGTASSVWTLAEGITDGGGSGGSNGGGRGGKKNR
ncbi:reprolysin-like metallopeptidase [uncultured Neptuniibacter sp.]|uniref:reprolysin-like metallopeptidase n=1 Tax=uncultured Neptuniibacter sp. TaxID=502143 RepID=UPI0026089C7F|nr:PKD domain-containing protein [uncultured Neptuniibacter sp.]